jgi:hypothetical protein
MDFSWLTMFISAGKVGGYVRGGVAGLLADMVMKYPSIADILTPTEQTAISTAIAGIVVGAWSHVAKNVQASAPPSPGMRAGGAIGAVIVAALFLFSSDTANAQVALKAPPKAAAPACTVYLCKMWAVFFDISGHATNVNVIGEGVNGSLLAGGATPHIGAEGFVWNGTYAYGVAAGCGYSVNVAGIGSAHGYDCFQEFEFGGSLGSLFNIAPANAPSPIIGAMMFPSVVVGPEENSTVKVGWRAGANLRFLLDPSTILTVGYRAVSGGNSTVTGGVTTTDNQTFVRVSRQF